MRIAQLVSMILLALSSAQASATTLTFADYPRYGLQAPAEHLPELKRFAQALVGAALAGKRVDVTVTGHADFDAKGRQFEIGVSAERAAAAEAAVRADFEKAADDAGLSAAQRSQVAFVSLGVGTARPVEPHPRNEAERRANRRVEITFSTAQLPAPPKVELMSRCKTALASSSAPPGPVRRMSCVCQLLGANPAALDYAYNYKAAQRARASAGSMKDWTSEQWHAFAHEMTFHLRGDIGRASDANASDSAFVSQLIALDDSVGSSIGDFSNQSAPNASAPDLFERVVMSDIGRRMTDANHVYACYAGYSRLKHNQ